jgi:catechol 2,3-dioxygenase-like lactoylglutathione lyase family enzyme
MITRLSHATIYVLDQDKAYDVYVNKLGFSVGTDMLMDNGFRWLTVKPPKQPDLDIILYAIGPVMIGEESAAALRKLAEQNILGSAVFETDDCQKSYEAMRANGIEFTQPPTQRFYGIEALFHDGCGNWFSLTQRTPQPA